MSASLIARINASTLGCNKGAAAALPEGSQREIYLFRAYGQIMGLERGETDLGEYYGITGRFQAENTQDGTDNAGKLFESDTLFLPPGGHESVVNRVMEMGVDWPEPNKRNKTVNGRIKDGKVLNIAVDVYVRRDKNPSGIGYITKPIFETPDDPLALIRAAILDVEKKAIAAQAGGNAGPAPAQLPAPEGDVNAQLAGGKRGR